MVRSALKRYGRLPHYILSELLTCEQCGGTFRAVNAREFGCASHVDGGATTCSNSLRVRIDLVERKLLGGQPARKSAEIDHLRALMKAATLSPAVVQAPIEKAKEELQALVRKAPQREERQTARDHPSPAKSLLRRCENVSGRATRGFGIRALDHPG